MQDTWLKKYCNLDERQKTMSKTAFSMMKLSNF